MKDLYHKIAKKVYRKASNILFAKNDKRFLKDISGLVHVGANAGQEGRLYNQYGLSVIWVEPIPKIFEQLENNIKEYNNQQAVQALLTDIDNREYEFHISNNNGVSSSIYELKHHKDLFPGIDYQGSITLRSTTLTTLFKRMSFDISNYQGLVLDTQGSELLVLKGSLPILKYFNYIKTEVADFESYEGCCILSDIKEFMYEHGFREFSRKIGAQSVAAGSYYDIVFKNN